MISKLCPKKEDVWLRFANIFLPEQLCVCDQSELYGEPASRSGETVFAGMLGGTC